MPIRYLSTLGAVVGIPEWGNVIEIEVSRPEPLEIAFTKPPAFIEIEFMKPEPLTVEATMSNGGD